MSTNRTKKLNSLLKEVLSEVIIREVRNPLVARLITITQVEITKDLRQAKVYISVIGTEKERAETIQLCHYFFPTPLRAESGLQTGIISR
ncbi:MAG: ribosome-binding factor A [Simkania negevensis]|nr:ribosome-binding factor A [Simkania negevensis]